MLERIKPTLNMNADIFTSGQVYNCIEIRYPILTTKKPGDDMSDDQKMFKVLTKESWTTRTKKALIVRSRYGSGKTTFLQRLVRARKPERVLFITYRQTLARDIMRNFDKLGFNNYLDSHEDPSVWNARLIVQLDSLMH
ncbi:MAG: DEAD/DEAH box helicase family protein, partial [Planctomycetota bacterium]